MDHGLGGASTMGRPRPAYMHWLTSAFGLSAVKCATRSTTVFLSTKREHLRSRALEILRAHYMYRYTLCKDIQ